MTVRCGLKVRVRVRVRGTRTLYPLAPRLLTVDRRGAASRSPRLFGGVAALPPVLFRFSQIRHAHSTRTALFEGT